MVDVLICVLVCGHACIMRDELDVVTEWGIHQKKKKNKSKILLIIIITSLEMITGHQVKV